MRKDKQHAVKLRKSGKSYEEIKRLLSIPKSTLSGWFGGEKWSREVKRVLSKKAEAIHRIRFRELNRVRGERLSALYEEARREARDEFENLKYHPLFISGVVIYWGEGDKVTEHQVRIANADPVMVKLFVEFLRSVCQIPPHRIKAWVLIYPDLHRDKCKKFWMKNSGLSAKNFTECIVIRGRHKTNRLHYGVCNVGVSSKYFKEKMRVWLALLPSQLAKKSYYAGFV